MEYLNSIENLKLNENTVITLGKFDGLHGGHKYLMDTMFLLKKEKNYKALVFTFDIPPASYIHSSQAKVITTNQEKRRLFAELGVDYFVECPFTEAVRSMKPEEFISFLVERLNVKAFVVGEDFHFGYKRAGDVHTIEALADKYGYEAFIKPKILYKNREISSTYIREELVAGNMKTATALLGYPYFIENKIIHGNRIGSAMGIPTVNMPIENGKVIPPKGVYVSKVIIDQKEYLGVSNIGNKPTIGENYPTGVETFIFDFCGDLYDKVIRISFLWFLRPEKKFDSLDLLKQQMERDIEEARKYYGNVTDIC